jgi:two-component system nitrate/nitrite response regulator NarL
VDVATDGRGALTQVRDHDPDVILLDLGLPDRSGLAVGQEILEDRPDAKVIVLTALDDARAVDEAQVSGFRGYLTKDTPVSRFVSAVEAVREGRTAFPTRQRGAGRRGRSRDYGSTISHLTPREREVLGMLVEGADSRAIARRFGISRNTVRTHVQSILTKLQVHTRLEAATYAVRHRLVPIQVDVVGEPEAG